MDTGSPSLDPSALAEAIAAAQGWWAEAGVDLLFEDEAQSWLSDPEAEQATPAGPAPFVPPVLAEPEAPPPAALGGEPAAWPQTLEAFGAWWTSDPSLDAGGLGPRLAPRGPAGSPLMVLVPMPEEGDADRLLDGPQGRLLAGFAAAAGIDPDSLFVAAALPRCMAAPDWAGLASRGLGEVLRHLVALAAPERLLVLGNDILPLLAHDPAISAPGRGQLAIQGRSLPMLAHYQPARLLGHARLRAGLWRHWLDWTDG